MLWCVVGRHATSSGKHSRVAEPWQDSIDCVAWQKVETFVYHRCETAVVSSRQTYWDQGWQRPPSNYNMPERNSESVMKVKRDIIGSQYLRVNLCLMISPGLLLRCGHDCAKCLLGVGRSCNELIFSFVYITAPSHTAQFAAACEIHFLMLTWIGSTTPPSQILHEALIVYRVPDDSIHHA